MTRVFDNADRARLKLTIRGKEFGFSIADIKEMLDLYHLDDGQVTQLRITTTKMEKQLQDLNLRHVELEKAIKELIRTKRAVTAMLREREARQSLGVGMPS